MLLLINAGLDQRGIQANELGVISAVENLLEVSQHGFRSRTRMQAGDVSVAQIRTELTGARIAERLDEITFGQRSRLMVMDQDSARGVADICGTFGTAGQNHPAFEQCGRNRRYQ